MVVRNLEHSLPTSATSDAELRRTFARRSFFFTLLQSAQHSLHLEGADCLELLYPNQASSLAVLQKCGSYRDILYRYVQTWAFVKTP